MARASVPSGTSEKQLLQAAPHDNQVEIGQPPTCSTVPAPNDARLLQHTRLLRRLTIEPLFVGETATTATINMVCYLQ